MTTRAKIIATVVALWAAVVAGLGVYYAQNPTYVQHNRPVRNTGNRIDDFYSEHFPKASFGTAVLIATGLAAVVIVIASVWTSPRSQ